MTSSAAAQRYAAPRHAMVEHQLRARGIRDERVLAAMEDVPRHCFVPAHQDYAAYDDGPLPIGCGQTISQPYMVARACELACVSEHDRVLDVGAGSGYQAAVLARLCERVVTIELIEELASHARRTLEALGISNVSVVVGDGTRGYAAEAPYQAIVVAAGAERVPDALIAQLAPGGRLVIPVGSGMQILTVLHKTERGIVRHRHELCAYVPLRGAEASPD